MRLILISLLLVATAVSTALASTAGEIKLGTWTANLGTAAGGKPSKATMKLTKSPGAAHLKLFRYTGTCTFPPNPSGQSLAPRTVTWTYNHVNSLGPIGFTRTRQSHQALDLDENQPGPISLVIHFDSATKAHATVQANYTVPNTGGSEVCFTGKSALDSRVRFTIRWSHG